MYALNQGGVQTLTQSEVYALPSGVNLVQSSVAVETSMDGTTWAALTGANTVGAQTAAKFIRCTTAAPTVGCKKL